MTKSDTPLKREPIGVTIRFGGSRASGKTFLSHHIETLLNADLVAPVAFRDPDEPDTLHVAVWAIQAKS